MNKAERIDDILAGVQAAIVNAAMRKAEGRAGGELRDAEAEKDYEDWRYYLLQAQAGGDE